MLYILSILSEEVDEIPILLVVVCIPGLQS